MKLYFIRHGETIANTQKKYLGISHSPFTQKGINANEENIRILSSLQVDAIYTSPSQRCLSSADALSKVISVPPITDDKLMELNFGIFENMTWQQAKENYTDEFEKWCQNTYEYQIPNGESQKDLDDRINLFIGEIKQSTYKNIAVFSHDGAIMSMISSLLKLEPSQKWRFKIAPGSIVTIDIQDDFAYLLL